MGKARAGFRNVGLILCVLTSVGCAAETSLETEGTELEAETAFSGEPASGYTGNVGAVSAALSSTARRTRAERIRDVAAQRGLFNGFLLGGIADAETTLAHCWSEATWACQGPHSNYCGGPVIAGAGDGPCSAQQGGLGMFQFDGGTYAQTLARDGHEILELDGNIDHAVDFVTNMVISSAYISGVSNSTEALDWMNAVRVGTSEFDAWISTVTRYYNGCSPTSSCWTSRRQRYNDHAVNIFNEMGGNAFWLATPLVPLGGDWNGNGKSGVGTYNSKTRLFAFRNPLSAGNANSAFAWGAIGDKPFVGDWNGDGKRTAGLFRPSNLKLYFRGSGSVQLLALAEDIPIAGDWDGDGDDTYGMYRPSLRQFSLKNDLNFDTNGWIQFTYGAAGDIPVAGDWNGNGKDTIGVYRPSNNTFYLNNQNNGGSAEYVIEYGGGYALPVIGDWNGNGRDGIGVFGPSTKHFFLRNDLSEGWADHIFEFGCSASPSASSSPAGAWSLALLGFAFLRRREKQS